MPDPATGGMESKDRNETPLRSGAWLAGANVSGLLHRSSLRAGGAPEAGDGRPIVGLCSSWSELVHCNVHLRALAGAARRGILEAGGVPVEFPTISLSENLMKPTTMLYRNLMSMDVEEMIRAHPLDAVVLLGGCDKTIPAQLMGAVSAGVPAIVVTGGPSSAARFQGRDLGVGTDLWKLTDEFRAGKLTAVEFRELEEALIPTNGHCNEMGTASTMAAITEALGMALMGSSTVLAGDGRRFADAVQAGRRAVGLAIEGLTPDKLLTSASLHNAITLLMALGGSTNAVVHLLALAGRLGIELPIDRFGEISDVTPQLANVRPSGRHLIGDLHEAGGVPAVLGELGDLLYLDALTVTGRTLGDEIGGSRSSMPAVVSSRRDPFAERGGLAIVRGNLAPRGAVIKRSAASPELLRHRGRAVVFEGIEDVARRIDDPNHLIDEDSVLVLRGVGPRGAPGMPEWGMIPIPEHLLRRGVRDLVRVSDARMSGTAFGTVVLHVTPESAVGGPLAAIRDGDPVVLDVDAGRIDIDIPAAELSRRLVTWTLPAPAVRRGYTSLFIERVLQADQGCDFDFLRAIPGEPADPRPIGLFSGWMGGW